MYGYRLFRSQISDARNCIKEANAAAGCLFNSLSPFSEVTNANVDYSTACGFNNGKLFSIIQGSESNLNQERAG